MKNNKLPINFKHILYGIFALPLILIALILILIAIIAISISKLFSGKANSKGSIANDLTMLSAKFGDAKSRMKMGDRYSEKKDITQNDKREALEWYLQASESGEPDGLAKIGLMYLYGDGIKQNSFKAFECFNVASLHGSALGKYGCGICKYNGTGTEKNISEAFKLLQEALEKELPLKEKNNACNILGKCYYYGYGTEQDYKKAFEYLINAPNESEYLIGECFFYGLGTEKNISQAEMWYKLAAEKGVKEAMDILGDIYYFGLHENKYSKEQAINFYEKAAKKHYIPSILKAALIYKNDDSDKTMKKAENLLKKYESSLRLGITKGGDPSYYYFLLGIAYCEGWGTPKSIQEAYFCFDRSYEFAQENSKIKLLSLFCLSICKKAGINLKKYETEENISSMLQTNGLYRLAYLLNNDRDEKSIELLKKSSELGNPASMHEEALILLEKGEYENAFNLLSKASEKGYKESILKLAECFEKGIGTEQNSELSEEYRKRGENILIDMFSPTMMCENLLKKY